MSRATLAVLGALSLLLVAMAALSLEWRIQHDAALMLYYAWLVNEQGFVLYRDLFEHQPPGAHVPYRVIGALAGYGDLGFRIIDLVWLAAIGAASAALMRGFGRAAAWSAGVLFPLLYLAQGSELSVQRDYLLILPVALALLVQVRLEALDERARAVLSGLLLGIAFNVKPQVGVLLPALLAFQAWAPGRGGGTGGRVGRMGIAVAGLAAFALPTLLVVAALFSQGTLGVFADTVRSYWPLFARLDGLHQTFEEGRRVRYTWTHLRGFGGHAYWLGPALLGVFLALSRPRLARRERGLAASLLILLPVAAAYTAASGRFWHYHWLPFLYFASLASSLCWLPVPDRASAAQRVLPIAALGVAVALSLQPRSDLRKQLRGEDPHPPLHGRVDEIAGYLRARSAPGDTVQALDWTGGAIHGMLEARSRAATPYVTDFSFYHHVSDPWIRAQRRRFVEALERARPRFVIQVETQKPWPRGVDTSVRFGALERWIESHYRLDYRGDGFRIYERLDAPGGDDPSAAGHSRGVD